MISMYDIKKAIKTKPEYAEAGYALDEKEENVIDTKNNNTVILSLKDLLDSSRKASHCDFECIYSEHASLFSLLRCKECGTVIFSYEDEDYDPNLRCPVCGGYHTTFKYYTKEEIESDPEKTKEIQMYEYLDKKQAEEYERYKKRGNLYDWQLWKKDIKITKKFILGLELQNLNGICLQIYPYILREGDSFPSCKKSYNIPLTPSALYKKIKFNIMYNRERKMMFNG